MMKGSISKCPSGRELLRPNPLFAFRVPTHCAFPAGRDSRVPENRSRLQELEFDKPASKANIFHMVCQRIRIARGIFFLITVKESAARWWCESIPKLGPETYPRNSAAILDSGSYSRGSPEQ